jgi:hypothetical protein
MPLHGNVRLCSAVWLDFNAGHQGKCRRAREPGGEPGAKTAGLGLTQACYRVKGVVSIATRQTNTVGTSAMKIAPR